MSINYTTKDNVATVQIIGDLTIYQAPVLKKNITSLSYSCDAVELDLHATEDIDTAGIQVLMLIKRELESLGKTMKVTAISDSVKATFNLLQLDLNTHAAYK